jgi:hypothetical protein
MGRVSPDSTLFFEQFLDEIRAIPGVETAGAISHFPTAIMGWHVRPFELPGKK